MTWNYRMTRRSVPPNGEHLYEVREIYYGDGAMGWTEHPIAPSGETRQEFLNELMRIVTDCTVNPVLDIDTGEWLNSQE